eukprot:720683-Pelagomonas_calceolata.AAC.5
MRGMEPNIGDCKEQKNDVGHEKTPTSIKGEVPILSSFVPVPFEPVVCRPWPCLAQVMIKMAILCLDRACFY